MSGYTGRFAPSPTGALHAGSLVAALASWVDARAHGGRWLVRIEDVDGPRCVPGADRVILQQLAACGLHPDEPPVWQSQRGALYEQALQRLLLTEVGSRVYVVGIDPTAADQPDDDAPPPPWYEQVWTSLQTADEPPTP